MASSSPGYTIPSPSLYVLALLACRSLPKLSVDGLEGGEGGQEATKIVFAG